MCSRTAVAVHRILGSGRSVGFEILILRGYNTRATYMETPQELRSIAKCKEAQSGEEFKRLFNAIRDDEKLRKSTCSTCGKVGGEVQKMRNSYPKQK